MEDECRRSAPIPPRPVRGRLRPLEDVGDAQRQARAARRASPDNRRRRSPAPRCASSVSSRAVSIRIGTLEVLPQRFGEFEAGLARHHHVEDEQIEMQAAELGARVRGIVGGRDAIAVRRARKRDSRSRMRRSSSTISRCGASSAGVTRTLAMQCSLPASVDHLGLGFRAWSARAISCSTSSRPLGIDHGDQEAPRRLVRAGAEFDEARA